MQRGGRMCGLVSLLGSGPRPLEGRSFYLDEVKSRQSSFITEVICRLGGKVESFLNKDVSAVVTGNREALTDRSSEVKGEAVASPRHQKESANSASRRPAKPRPQVCGSRGKALLEKAILNNEKSRGGVLANARSWGVKIVAVDEFLKFIDRLTAELSAQKSKRSEKKTSDTLGQRVVKAGVLKPGFVKVEDCSRKYRPLHTQSVSFPMLSYTGRFSPFETPAPPRPCRRKEEEELSKDQLRKSEEPISSHDKPSAPHQHPPSSRRPRKKDSGYCECCQICYSDRDEHLVSDLHRRFAQDITNYAVVDRLVESMDGGFSSWPDHHTDPTLMRLACDSPGPLSPSGGMEQNSVNKTESELLMVLLQSPDPQAVNAIIDSVGTNPDFTAVPDLVPHSSVPATFEGKCDKENVNHNLVLHPDYQPQISNDCFKDQDPHPLTVEYDLIASAPKEKSEVESDSIKPSRSPLLQQQPAINKEEDSLSCCKTPKQTIVEWKEETGAVLEQVSSQLAVEPTKSPLVVKLSNGDHSSERVSSLDVLLSSASSPLLSVKRLKEANPRKRCRSLTLSPTNPSKKRRTVLWSGDVSSLPKEDGADSGPLSVVDRMKNEANPVTQANDFETLNSAMPRYDGLGTQTSTFAKDYEIDEHADCGSWNGNVTELIPSRKPEPKSRSAAVSQTGTLSELSPPELYPFYYDDDNIVQQRWQRSFTDPPMLTPAVPPPSVSEKASRLALSQASSASLLSQSFSSVCIESALIPDFTFSPTSSESDWDSGLVSRLGQGVHVQPKAGNYELDLSLLLQRSCTGLQDGNYASQLCSVLQPAIPSSASFGDKMSQNSLYRPIETMDRWIIQSLGV